MGIFDKFSKLSKMTVRDLLNEKQTVDKIVNMKISGEGNRIPTVKDDGLTDRERMENIGLKLYEWSTCGDERVRPSHALMEGKLCKWTDPTVYSSDGGKTWKLRPKGSVSFHPGEDKDCRCCALSYEKELFGEM